MRFSEPPASRIFNQLLIDRVLSRRSFQMDSRDWDDRNPKIRAGLKTKAGDRLATEISRYEFFDF